MSAGNGEVARILIARGRKAVRDGMPSPKDEEAWVGAGLMIAAKLRTTTSESGASDAADIALEMTETTLAKRSRSVPVACKRGCSYCCRGTAVATTAPEIFRIARWLHRNAAIKPALAPAAVANRCESRAGLNVAAISRTREACPLLIDDACGVYAVRPINCRQVLSSSVEACRAHYNGLAGPVPYVEEAQHKAAHTRSLLLGAIEAADRDSTSYELTQGLAIALREPDSEKRWLAGEDVFAAAVIKKDMENLKEAANHWSSQIRKAL